MSFGETLSTPSPAAGGACVVAIVPEKILEDRSRSVSTRVSGVVSVSLHTLTATVWSVPGSVSRSPSPTITSSEPASQAKKSCANVTLNGSASSASVATPVRTAE